MDRELQELTVRVKALEESDVEHRRVQRMIYGDMGKLARESSESRRDLAEIKSVLHRLESSLVGTHRESSPSHHDLEKMVQQAAKETAAEITGGHIIPPGGPKTLSDRVREINKNDRNETVAAVVAKVATTILVAIALLVTGMAIRDCQHGTVPTQLH
jgi:hypothetical protein